MAWSRALQNFFFANSKSRAQELSNDVSFVIFGHQTWDSEGGQIDPPPQQILVFKYPSRDRVKIFTIFLLCDNFVLTGRVTLVENSAKLSSATKLKIHRRNF